MRPTAWPVAAAMVLAACASDDTTGEATDTEATDTEDPGDPGDPGTDPDDPTETDVDGDEVEEDVFDAPDGEGAEQPPGGFRQPAWAEAPVNEVGSIVALDPVVVEGDHVVVAVDSLTVHSSGVAFEVAVRIDPAEVETVGPIDDNPLRTDMGPTDDDTEADGDLPDDLLRLAVRYPDGQTASTIDGFAAAPPDDGEEPDEPRLTPGMGQGAGVTWDEQLWLWPLPEPGDQPMELIVEWPDAGIDQHSAIIDVDDVAAARDEVIELWPDERPES